MFQLGLNHLFIHMYAYTYLLTQEHLSYPSSEVPVMYVCMYVCLYICTVKLLLESGVAFANEFNHLQYDIESLRGVYVYV